MKSIYVRLKLAAHQLFETKEGLRKALRPGIAPARLHRDAILEKSSLHVPGADSYLPTTETLGGMLGLTTPEFAPAVRSA